MKKINTVFFTKEHSHSCPDLELEKWFQSVLSSNENVVYLSTDLQLTRLRLAVKQKSISTFTLNINNKISKCNEKGQLSDYPEELSTLHNLLFSLSR